MSLQASILKPEVTAVGSTTPVADFLALIGRKTENMLVTASKQLIARINDLVDLYVGGSTDPFLSMVQTLRKELVHDESKLFNDFCACRGVVLTPN